MPVGKKVMFLLSILATGGGAALFFRKDAAQADARPGTLSNPFGQRVEHRIIAGAAWARKIGGPLPAVDSQPKSQARVASMTAQIAEPTPKPPETPPTYQKGFAPVGTLLEPIDGVPPAEDEPAAGEDFQPLDELGGAPLMHRVADGDTLTKLAIQYLGRADRYLEIFALNREVLTSPDLLPIGASLKIPSRGRRPSPSRVEEPMGEMPLPVIRIPAAVDRPAN